MMTWQQFAVNLFRTEDADPGYMMLARADLRLDQKMRFMAAWITYYHPGIAARASEERGKEFWHYLADHYATAKRASERRHFRGEQGRKAMKSWFHNWPQPEGLVIHMQGKTYFEVRQKSKTVAQIGDYFIWKFADVQERVFRVPCDFTGAEEHSPKVPQEGAKLIALTPEERLAVTYRRIYGHLRMKNIKSPPWYDRGCNMQEAETVCCVYKQYTKGKWTPESRTAKATRRLLSMPCRTTDALIEALHRRSERAHWKHGELAQWADNLLGAE